MIARAGASLCFASVRQLTDDNTDYQTGNDSYRSIKRIRTRICDIYYTCGYGSAYNDAGENNRSRSNN